MPTRPRRSAIMVCVLMAVLGFGSAGMLSRRRARGKCVLPPPPPCTHCAVSPVNNRENTGGAPGGVRSADRAPSVRHVEVAAFIVNNNSETMERSRRSFPTAAGWFSRLNRLSSRPTLATARGEPRPITTGGDHGSPLTGSPRRGRRGVPLAGTTGWRHVGFVRPKRSARAPQDEDASACGSAAHR